MPISPGGALTLHPGVNPGQSTPIGGKSSPFSRRRARDRGARRPGGVRWRARKSGKIDPLALVKEVRRLRGIVLTGPQVLQPRLRDSVAVRGAPDQRGDQC